MLLMDGSAGSGADAEADDDVDATFTQAQGKVLISRAAELLRDLKEGGFLFTTSTKRCNHPRVCGPEHAHGLVSAGVHPHDPTHKSGSGLTHLPRPFTPSHRFPSRSCSRATRRCIGFFGVWCRPPGSICLPSKTPRAPKSPPGLPSPRRPPSVQYQQGDPQSLPRQHGALEMLSQPRRAEVAALLCELMEKSLKRAAKKGAVPDRR